jgi:hypothetical protein
MRSSLRIFVAGLAIAAGTLVVTAQNRPALNGVWKMNPAQSKFSDPDATPKEIILKLDLQGQTLHETLTVVSARGKSTVSLKYDLGGAVSTNNVDDEEIRSTASWSGDELVLAWNDKGGTFTRRFAFSDQGRKITVNVHDTNPDGQTNDLLVFEKQ